MTTHQSLRKSLRTIPRFRSLTSRELDGLQSQMCRMHYQKGEELWGSGDALDIIAVVQEGAILIKDPSKNDGDYVVLEPGDYYDPQDFPDTIAVADDAAYVIEDAVVYLLQQETWQESLSESVGVASPITQPLPVTAVPAGWRRLGWTILIGIAVALAWTEITGVVNGALCLAADELEKRSGPYAAVALIESVPWLSHHAACAQIRKGTSWYALGKPAIAEEAFRYALAIDNDEGTAWNNLGIIYRTWGQKEQAIQMAQWARERTSDRPIPAYNLGLLYLDDGDYARAISALRQATYARPFWYPPYVHLSDAYCQTGDIEAAEAMARKAVSLAPDRHTTHMALGIVLYNEGKREAARSSFAQAIALKPDDVASRFYHALVMQELGRNREALDAFEDLLTFELTPEQHARIAIEVDRLVKAGELEGGVAEP